MSNQADPNQSDPRGWGTVPSGRCTACGHPLKPVPIVPILVVIILLLFSALMYVIYVPGARPGGL